jgi:uncharacterized membrane protein
MHLNPVMPTLISMTFDPSAAATKPSRLYQSLVFSTISFGILLRLWQYFSNRSLWADEAAIAYNIVKRSYGQLLQPLLRNQAAPVGFLWVEKLSVQLLGNNELALRLFPLIAGIAAIFLFYRLAKQYLNLTGTIIALIWFCSCKELIYYSSEVKQYSSDVAIALLCFFLVQSLTKPSLTGKQAIALALSGAILIWFSHPSVFTLLGAGIGALIIQTKTLQVPNSQRSKSVFVLTAWLLSFLCFYSVSLRNISDSNFLSDYWKERSAFPVGLFDFKWMVQTGINFFTLPLGWHYPLNLLAFLVFLIGCACLIRRDRLLLPWLLSPAIATLTATFLQKYPFQERLVLFLTPFVLIVIAAGASRFRIQNSKFKIQNLESKTQNPKSKIQNPKSYSVAPQNIAKTPILHFLIIFLLTASLLFPSAHLLVQLN